MSLASGFEWKAPESEVHTIVATKQPQISRRDHCLKVMIDQSKAQLRMSLVVSNQIEGQSTITSIFLKNIRVIKAKDSFFKIFCFLYF